jgi:hypothetical protein
MMNNLRENNASVFDSSDPDPRNWKKIAHVEDPLWRGKYPNPFHMVFSMDSKKLYFSILHPLLLDPTSVTGAERCHGG